MNIPFETPELRALRERARVALEMSGFVLEEEIREFPLPAKFGSAASISGNFQSVSDDGVVRCFYLVLDPLKKLAGWLVQRAEAARAVDEVEVNVLCDHPSDRLVRDCGEHGAGLYSISEDGVVQELAASTQDADALARALAERLKEATYNFETKRNFDEHELNVDNASVRDLVADMDPVDREEWLRELQREARERAAWADEVEGLLVEAEADPTEELVERIERLIKREPGGLG